MNADELALKRLDRDGEWLSVYFKIAPGIGDMECRVEDVPEWADLNTVLLCPQTLSKEIEESLENQEKEA